MHDQHDRSPSTIDTAVRQPRATATPDAGRWGPLTIALVYGLSTALLALPQWLWNRVFSRDLDTNVSDAVAWISSVTAAALLISLLAARHRHRHLLAVLAIWLGIGIGVAPLVTVLLWLLSAWCCGLAISKALGHSARETSATQAIVLGAATILAVWGAMLHFTVNFAWSYLAICVLPCLLPGKPLLSVMADARLRLQSATAWAQSMPFWMWTVGLIAIGWVLRWASFPSLGYDDHTLHLRLWTELQSTHRFSFDVESQVWSVAPFVVDLLHAGLSLISGGDARGALNCGLAVLTLILMARILHIWQLSTERQWLLLVLMASTPMLGSLLLTLHTELALSLVALAGMRLVIACHSSSSKESLGVLGCAALCASLKLPGAVLGLALLVALLVRMGWVKRAQILDSVATGQHARVPVAVKPLSAHLDRRALLLLVPLTFVALHAYVLAWIMTGNPVFPLYNGIFQSPLFPQVNFSDPRWIQGFSLQSYWSAFFHTSRFFEGGDHTAGWQFLLLLPVAMIASFRGSAGHGPRLLLIPVLGFGLIMFSATQYWRYLYPVMPIAGLMLSTLWSTHHPIWRYSITTLTLVCISLNLYSFPRVSWMMATPAGIAFSEHGKQALTLSHAPAAALTELLNHTAATARVLYPPNIPYGATLNGTAWYANWYAPSRQEIYARITDQEAVAAFLKSEGIDFVISDMNDTRTTVIPETLLRRHLANHGYALARAGSLILYRVTDVSATYRQAFDLRTSLVKNQTSVPPEKGIRIEPVTATPDHKILASFQTHRAQQARYRIRFVCPTNEGFFVAQINWNLGQPYYRLIECANTPIDFVEAMPIPLGATEGQIYVTTRNATTARIDDLDIALH